VGTRRVGGGAVSRFSVQLCLAGVLLLQTASVRAYDGVDSFLLPAIEGGGGGRFFTGSRRDGQTCAVCHTSSYPASAVEVSGLPRAGYLPGRIYELDVYWPVTGGVGSAAILEMTSHWTSAPAGELLLPPADELGEGELCRGRPALERRQTPDRSLLALELCSTDRMHFFWKAPDTSVGPVWLDMAMLIADGDGSHAGDLTGSARRFIPAANAPIESASVQQGCAVAGRAPGASLLWVGLLLFLRRRRARGGPPG